MDIKFIVLNINGEDHIFTFPTIIQHKEMKETIQVKVYFAGFEDIKLISAGFVLDNEFCKGDSLTLNISTRGKEDSKLLHTENHCYINKPSDIDDYISTNLKCEDSDDE